MWPDDYRTKRKRFTNSGQKTQRKRSHSSRVGKGEGIMPVPGGEITTTEILVPVVEEVEDDLPELS
jgi:hypothetical protein